MNSMLKKSEKTFLHAMGWILLLACQSGGLEAADPIGSRAAESVGAAGSAGSTSTADSAATAAPAAGARAAKLVSTNGRIPFSEAQPEDLTNENFGDLVESFDFPNVDINDVIKAISELTGKNFLVENGVQGKITILAPSRITVAEAYKAFLSALAVNKLVVVPTPNGYDKIRSIINAKTDSIETYSGDYYPNSDYYVTRILHLKYISADELSKSLGSTLFKGGDLSAYAPTNSIIFTDFGSNVDRVMKIIDQLDVPGFEERMEVIPIRHAKAKDIADLINQIINKGEKTTGPRPPFGGIPRFGAPRGTQGGSMEFSLVLPDERTSSIIVVGNKGGIDKVRKLVQQLDFKLMAEESGGVHVYPVKYAEAKKIEETLKGVTADAAKNQRSQGSQGGSQGLIGVPQAERQEPIFGGNVNFTADVTTNSLIITASKQDYEIVKNLLAKIDVPLDQVYVQAAILEMNVSSKLNFSMNIVKFKSNPQTGEAAGYSGFVSSDNLLSLLSPTSQGAVIGFGTGDIVKVKIPGATASEFSITSLAGLISFFKVHTDTNILSTPQIMALNNQKAVIEVGDDVVSGVSTVLTAVGQQSTPTRDKATIKMEIEPFISPDSDMVRMKVKQDAKQQSKTVTSGQTLTSAGPTFNTRSIDTNISVRSGDTAVLGGLMSSNENEEIAKVPLLGDIPILGWLFKRKTTEVVKLNLLVFISPSIIRSPQDHDSLVGRKIEERANFIKQYMNGRDPYGQDVDKIQKNILSKNDSEASSGSSDSNLEGKDGKDIVDQKLGE